MLKDEYSPYKIVHQINKLNDLKNGNQTTPIQIHLVPVNGCNHNCKYCAYHLEDHTSNQLFDIKDIIPKDKLFEIIDSCKELGIKAIQLTGGGEPLLHPNIKEFILKAKTSGIELGLVTNGSKLDDELIEMLKDISWVRISIDAFTNGTYESYRKTGKDSFSKVCDNIRKLVAIKTTTILGISFVVNKVNYREIYDSAKMFKDMGVDNFRISGIFSPEGIHHFDGFLEDAQNMARATAGLTDEKFTVFNLFTDRIRDLFHGKQEYDFCPMKDLVPYVGADMNVYTCCIYAYNQMGLIGSITEQSLAQLWKSDEKVKFFNAHNPKKMCQIPCMFEKKNEFINYCIKQNAKHIDFI